MLRMLINYDAEDRRNPAYLKKVLVTAAFHPLNYSKVLMQYGYEPLPLAVGQSAIVFGAKKYIQPNAFAYMNYIYRQEGCVGLFRGVGAAMGSNFLGLYVYDKVYDFLNQRFPESSPDDCNGDNTLFERRMTELCKKTVAKIAGIVAARPLRVVMLRSMAEFVGSGEKYSRSWLHGLESLFSESGFGGLFKGLVPELVAEICFLWLCAHLSYGFEILEKYIFPPTEVRPCIEGRRLEDPLSTENVCKFAATFLIPHFAKGFFYPLHLTSTLMSVNNCGLQVGQPPYCPAFTDWQDCYRYLEATNQLKRGSKVFFRAYDGPVVLEGSAVYASMERLKDAKRKAI